MANFSITQKSSKNLMQSTPKVTYYVGDGQKVRYFGMYVTLGSKFGSFLIVWTKNDVRYVGGYIILGIRYFRSQLYFEEK
jgi:hypothetical protein